MIECESEVGASGNRPNNVDLLQPGLGGHSASDQFRVEGNKG